MVDFDNEATITTPPAEIVKVMLLERRKYLIDAVEYYYKKKYNRVKPEFGVVASRLIALFYELREELVRFYKKEVFDVLEKDILTLNDFDKAIEIMKKINEWFDEKRLTRIDTIKRYDSTNVEIENREKGL